MCALFCIIIFTIGRSFIAMLYTSLPSSFGFLVRFPWFIVSMLIVRDEVNSCVLRWSTGGRSVGCMSDPRISANARMISGSSCDLSFFIQSKWKLNRISGYWLCIPVLVHGGTFPSMAEVELFF